MSSLLKTSIEHAFLDQKALFEQKVVGHIPRTFLESYEPHPTHIEVISGIRRCGKSTLMRQIMNAYYPDAAYFNFEDARIFGFQVSDFQKLDDIIPRNTSAYFFDEIQNVEHWEVFVRQLHDRGKKVFVTGSNASLLSRELGTRLTGRHLKHDLLPFSYMEFLEYLHVDNTPEVYQDYLNNGGFPEYLDTLNTQVLQNLFKDILLRDIAVRHGIRNTHALMELALHLISNSGKETSYNSLRKMFDIGSTNTVSDYIAWMEDAWILFQLQRFGRSQKSRTASPRKVYGIDTGLVRANSVSFSKDTGRGLENAIFLHLKRSGYELYYFREQKECDFVVFQNKKIRECIQVCHEVTDENLQRETSGLIEALNTFGLEVGSIITSHQKDKLTISDKTIHLIPAHEFCSA